MDAKFLLCWMSFLIPVREFTHQISSILHLLTDSQGKAREEVKFIIFRVRHSQDEMYIGHGRLCVSVCQSLTAFPHYCMNPDVTCGNGKECPLVVHYCTDLQSVHAFRCYDSIHACNLIALYTASAYSAEREMSASACTHSVAGLS